MPWTDVTFDFDTYVEGETGDVTITATVDQDQPSLNQHGLTFHNAFDLSGVSISALYPGFTYQLRDFLPGAGGDWTFPTAPGAANTTGIEIYQSAGAYSADVAGTGNQGWLGFSFINWPGGFGTVVLSGNQIQIVVKNVTNPAAGTYTGSAFAFGNATQSGAWPSGYSATDIVIVAPSSPPSVTTQAATSVGVYGATIRGLVTANGSEATPVFEYSTASDLSGATTVPASPSSVAAEGVDVAVSAVLADLEPATTYYFRVSAENDDGAVEGSILSFTTLVEPRGELDADVSAVPLLSMAASARPVLEADIVTSAVLTAEVVSG